VVPPHRVDAKEGPLISRAVAALLVSLLTGCAAFNFTEAECRAINWYERGERDGFGGHPTQIVRLREQCARHGVMVAEADYLKGWAIGHDEHERLKTMKCD
jgi:hypothetical protein